MDIVEGRAVPRDPARMEIHSDLMRRLARQQERRLPWEEEVKIDPVLAYHLGLRRATK